jgi:hypothetical protein
MGNLLFLEGDVKNEAESFTQGGTRGESGTGWGKAEILKMIVWKGGPVKGAGRSGLLE